MPTLHLARQHFILPVPCFELIKLVPHLAILSTAFDKLDRRQVAGGGSLCYRLLRSSHDAFVVFLVVRD